MLFHKSLSGMFLLAALMGCQPSPSGKDAQRREVTSKPQAAEDAWAGGRYIDLTHTYNEHTIYWPTADGFRFTQQTAGKTPAGYFYAANSFTTAEHGGTHIDAPVHFAEEGQTVDQIPLGRLIGEGVVIDVSQQCAEDPDYQIRLEDLREWEQRHQRQLVEVIVLLRTGYGKHWPDRKKYLGTDQRGPQAAKNLHFPGLHPEAAQWLAEQRMPKAVGIDTASIDYGPSRKFPAHVTLLRYNIPALENVAQLHELPETGFQVVALPMKIGGGSGGPTRIVAILPSHEP